MFGPPWTIPLEFPMFQVTAYLLARIGWMDIDLSCRVAGLFYYYLSALFLYMFCRTVFRDKMVCWCIILFYLWSPFIILFSRNCMIDFTSVAWALGYMLLFRQWLQKTDSVLLAVLTLLTGCLAYLTKITTMAAYVIPIGCFIIKHFWIQGKNFRGVVTYLYNKKHIFLWTLCCVFVPVIIGYLWVIYTDQIKTASAYTTRFTSENLKQWNFGTWEQRMQFSHWWTITYRIISQIVPYIFFLFPVGVFFGFRKYSEDGRILFLTALAGVFLPIAVFFNLYWVHDYYLIAVSPLLAIVAGMGVHYMCFCCIPKRHLYLAVIAIFCAASLYKGSWLVRSNLSDHEPHIFYKQGKAIQKCTEPNERVAAESYYWNPAVLYYAKRKGFMIDQPLDKQTCQFLKDSDFSIVACYKEHPLLFSVWKYRQLLETVGEFKIYRVSDNLPNGKM
ncbi:MAG: hypothetical protein GY749_35005 [Desulfobacteraceae bacterium]|nr:hypothetical protein [Desulfobacteraceae bacterium]